MGYKNFTITGVGTHGCFIKLSKEVYEFWSNVIEEHGDNLLIDYMIKFDEDGYDTGLLDSIIDYSVDESVALADDDAYVEINGVKRHKITTKGWDLKVLWQDGSTSWLSLAHLKDSHPI